MIFAEIFMIFVKNDQGFERGSGSKMSKHKLKIHLIGDVFSRRSWGGEGIFSYIVLIKRKRPLSGPL